MAVPPGSLDWGFPRWRSYGASTEATTVGYATGMAATCRATAGAKITNRPDRWWFCETAAAEYNRGWNLL